MCRYVEHPEPPIEVRWGVASPPGAAGARQRCQTALQGWQPRARAPAQTGCGHRWLRLSGRKLRVAGEEHLLTFLLRTACALGAECSIDHRVELHVCGHQTGVHGERVVVLGQ